MTGTLAKLWVAALVLLATHFGISSTSLRPTLVGAIGEGAYRALYSVIALAAMVWLVMAFNRAPFGPVLWDLGAAGDAVVTIVMPIALVLLVAGVSQPNPTAVGSEGRLSEPGIARGVLRITRNPVMWAIGLWAVAHLAANGELRAIGLFGSLAVLALLGASLIDLKNRKQRPRDFAPLEMSTSNLPFLAIVQGRQSFAKAMREIGILRIVAVVALYAGLLHGHAWLFGVAAYPG